MTIAGFNRFHEVGFCSNQCGYDNDPYKMGRRKPFSFAAIINSLDMNEPKFHCTRETEIATLIYIYREREYTYVERERERHGDREIARH